MSEYVLVILRDVERFAEEMGVTGVYREALPDAVRQFNRALEWAKQDDPANPTWQILQPLDEDGTASATLALSCRALADVLREKSRKAKGAPTWFVTEDAELQGSYQGMVDIAEGCTFTLAGSLEGKVIIRDRATFVNCGYLEGDVEKSPVGRFVNEGRLEGSIRPLASE
ncbi:MAG: hypothetical protein K6T78_03455 [Alicyclobacillus sp.]|nr:hypothetical protein [Alicyclobacillus sp.]